MLCGMSDAENPKSEPELTDTPAPEKKDLAETQELAPEDRPEETTTAATPDRQVVYVHAPVPPKVIHNRLFGALLALLGTAVYGASTPPGRRSSSRSLRVRASTPASSASSTIRRSGFPCCSIWSRPSLPHSS